MKNQEIAKIFYEIADYLEMEEVAPAPNFARGVTAMPSPSERPIRPRASQEFYQRLI